MDSKNDINAEQINPVGYLRYEYNGELVPYHSNADMLKAYDDAMDIYGPENVSYQGVTDDELKHKLAAVYAGQYGLDIESQSDEKRVPDKVTQDDNKLSEYPPDKQDNSLVLSQSLESINNGFNSDNKISLAEFAAKYNLKVSSAQTKEFYFFFTEGFSVGHMEGLVDGYHQGLKERHPDEWQKGFDSVVKGKGDPEQLSVNTISENHKNGAIKLNNKSLEYFWRQGYEISYVAGLENGHQYALSLDDTSSRIAYIHGKNAGNKLIEERLDYKSQFVDLLAKYYNRRGIMGLNPVKDIASIADIPYKQIEARAAELKQMKPKGITMQ